MILGAHYLCRLMVPKRLIRLGFGALSLAGLGTVVVGLFPENTIAILHIIGAGMPFFVGNIGMILLSISLQVPRWLRIYTFASGAFALLMLGLFLSGHYYSLGIGGMERLVAYPQTIWLIVFGVHRLRN